jgi:hypothetical protein
LASLHATGHGLPSPALVGCVPPPEGLIAAVSYPPAPAAARTPYPARGPPLV